MGGATIPATMSPIDGSSKAGSTEYYTREGYALDWTLNVYKGGGEKGFPKTTDPHALTIIENTKRFEAWAREHNR